MTEARPNKPIPLVEYKDVNPKDCPYTIYVNPEAASDVLLAAGLSQTEIENTSIVIQGQPDKEEEINTKMVSFGLGYTAGTCKTKNGKTEIGIYTDMLWKQRLDIEFRATEILYNNSDIYRHLKLGPLKFSSFIPREKAFHELKSGKRLAKYLEVAPEKRARIQLNRLLNTWTNQQINSTLRHEAKHAKKKPLSVSAKDKLGDAISILTVGSLTTAAIASIDNLINGKIDLNIDAIIALPIWTLASLPVAYWINRDERRARKFASDTISLPNAISMRYATIEDVKALN